MFILVNREVDGGVDGILNWVVGDWSFYYFFSIFWILGFFRDWVFREFGVKEFLEEDVIGKLVSL